MAAALELVGERWSMLIVRESWLGNTRFSDMVAGTGAPRDRIAESFKSLKDAGVVVRRRYQDSPPRFDYQLTDSGQGALPVIDGLLAWGLRLAIDRDDPDLTRRSPTPVARIERTT
ncbi:MAG: winged helix-turn-helix transcriptional regulator [Mycobacterium sp.]